MADAPIQQSSPSGISRVASATLLALSGAAGLGGIFLPWFIFSRSIVSQGTVYYSEPSLIDGLVLVVTAGAGLLSILVIVPALDVFALLVAYRLLRGVIDRSWLLAVCIVSLLCLAVALLVDLLSPWFSLGPPFIPPGPGVGQLVSLLSFIVTFAGALLALVRGRGKNP